MLNKDDILPCKWLLTKQLGYSNVRLWDLLILIPNLLFFAFLAYGVKRARLKLRVTRMLVISAFYYLIWLCNILNILRCIVYMTFAAKNPIEDTIDKLLWIILRFFLLSTELSVLIFGLAFGRLDSKNSIRWVMFFSSLISMLYSIIQGYLEIYMPDKHFRMNDKDYEIFAHGGMLFLFVTSVIFSCMYLTILLLPKTKIKEKIALPTKKSFYYYCSFLAALNLIQAIGSFLLFLNIPYTMCMVDLTTYTYLIGFAPLVYRTFLKGVFKITYANLFSYQPQINPSNYMEDDDAMSLPQQSIYSNNTGSEIINSKHSLFDNLNLDFAFGGHEKTTDVCRTQSKRESVSDIANRIILTSPSSPVNQFLPDHFKMTKEPVLTIKESQTPPDTRGKIEK